MTETALDYQSFLAAKDRTFKPVGFKPDSLNPHLMPFQKAIVTRALVQGRFAIFAKMGLGKTLMELEWANQVHQKTGEKILIFTPIAVGHQFITEAEKFGIKGVKLVTNQSDCDAPICVTNYEKMHKFTPSKFGGIVLDESSILKGFGGKTRKALNDFADCISYRLCGTATPSPNDLLELSNHSEYLGVLSGKEVIAIFFKQDGNTTHAWRLRHHAIKPFYKWLSSWSVAVQKPSDIGFCDGDADYELPDLKEKVITVKTTAEAHGTLFVMPASTLNERRDARKASLSERVKSAAKLVNNSSEPWLLWCDFNDESEALVKAIPDAVEVTGSMSPELKEKHLSGFSNGDIRVLVSKPSIAGFGLNWQHCHNMIFVGVSDSFEQQYQAIGRCHRFGQTEQVNVYYLISEPEKVVLHNIERKKQQHDELMSELVMAMSQEYQALGRDEMEIINKEAKGKNWKLLLGDSIERTKEIPSESIGHIVFSPPFPGMYVYSNSNRDVGNAKDADEIVNHMSFLFKELYRISMHGRNCCVHITQMPLFKGVDGFVGMVDFRGKLISAMVEAGWIHYGEITIDKNPQLKAIRTKDATLSFGGLGKDSCKSRPAFADMLVIFHKPGENPTPVRAGEQNNQNYWITNDQWIRWARPVWYAQDWCPDGDGIRETDVLNVKAAKEKEDERHLCPLQLGVVKRSVLLYSNPGDTVFSPFAGIGSEGYEALRNGRKFIGIELKESYWKTACKNLEQADTQGGQLSLMDMLAG